MISYTQKSVVLDGTRAFADFELDAYANLTLELELAEAAELEILLGEVRNADDSINREPGGFRTIRSMKKSCPAGKSSFAFDIPLHQSPYWHTVTVRTPLEAGSEVVPFRYVEINGGKGTATLIRKELYGEFDDNAACFKSSNENLNRIWEFCKYSMKATGAFGVYIDGERERKPYEGDAFTNMLGDLCSGGSSETAFATLRWLFDKPTYPTEWQLLAPFLLKEFHLYSGRTDDFKRLLGKLKFNFRPLLRDMDDDFLLRDGCPAGNPRTSGGARLDIVDWPISERDDYEFGEVNLVPNCYWYGALKIMAEMTGEQEYSDLAIKVKESIFRTMYRSETGLFVDNPESEHTALHSAFFPIYFGLTENLDIEPLKAMIRSKGMVCSVYGAHFLIESCSICGMNDVALQLITSDGLRSYNNMLRCGATISMEAWDDSLKANQDWNHAWGAAPANLIPRCIAGIKPLEPGFSKFSVMPRPGNIQNFYIKHPTPHGAIELEYNAGKCILTVPPETTAVTAEGEFTAGKHTLLLS